MTWLNPQDNDDSALQRAMSSVASAVADPSRLSMLCALMDGRAWTATELSMVAEIAPSTASGHLTRLLNDGLVLCLSQGRHRYYRLAGQEIASLVENLMGVAMQPRLSPRTRPPVHLRYARTCYDHLAGELAVGIYAFMLNHGWISEEGDALTSRGREQFLRLGIHPDTSSRRKACCPCLDWSERRFHLAGAAGAALLRLFIDKGWLQNTAGYRHLMVTTSGRTAFKRLFAIDPPAPGAEPRR